MSCYLRHMKNILEEAGIEVTPDNKKELDQALHKIVGVTYKDCPATWQRLKQELASDGQKREEFIQKLQHTIH